MNAVKGAAAILAAAMLAASLAACGTDTGWVAKSGEDTMPAGVYILSEVDSYYTAQPEWVKTLGDSSTVPQDEAGKARQFMRADVGGITGAQKIKEEADKQTKRYFATEKLFRDRGLSLTEETENAVAQNNNMIWQYNGAFYEQNGISKNSVDLSTRNYTKRNELMTDLYAADGERPFTDEDYENYFRETRRRIRYIPFYLTDDNGAALSEEEEKKVEEEAGAYLERANKGEDFSALLAEYQKAQTGTDLPDTTPGAYDALVTKDSTSPSEVMIGEMFDAPENEARLVRDTGVILLCMRVDTLFNRDDFESSKAAILKEVKQDDFDAWLDEQAAALEITYNDAALKRYTPEKLNFKTPK